MVGDFFSGNLHLDLQNRHLTARCISRHHNVARSSKLSLWHRKRLEKLLTIRFSPLSALAMLQDDAGSKPQRCARRSAKLCVWARAIARAAKNLAVSPHF